MDKLLLIMSEMRLLLTQIDSTVATINQVSGASKDVLGNSVPELMSKYAALSDMVANNPYLNNTGDNRSNLSYRAAVESLEMDTMLGSYDKVSDNVTKELIIIRFAQFTTTLLGVEMGTMIFDYIRKNASTFDVLSKNSDVVNVYSKENLARFMVLAFNSPVHNSSSEFYMHFFNLMTDLARGKLIDSTDMAEWVKAGGASEAGNIKPSTSYGINWNQFKNGLDNDPMRWYQDQAGLIQTPDWVASFRQKVDEMMTSFTLHQDVIRDVDNEVFEMRSPSFPFLLNRRRLQLVSKLLAGSGMNNFSI